MIVRDRKPDSLRHICQSDNNFLYPTFIVVCTATNLASIMYSSSSSSSRPCFFPRRQTAIVSNRHHQKKVKDRAHYILTDRGRLRISCIESEMIMTMLSGFFQINNKNVVLHGWFSQQTHTKIYSAAFQQATKSADRCGDRQMYRIR